MRITDLNELESKNPTLWNSISKSLLEDIYHLAQAKFENDKHKKFKIEIRLREITEEYD